MPRMLQNSLFLHEKNTQAHIPWAKTTRTWAKCSVSHIQGHLQTLFRGSDQWTVIDLLSGVVADVLQLFLRDFIHRANDMRKGHGSGATTSGHVIFLHNENQGTASFLARFPQLWLLGPRLVTPSQRTQPGNRSWNFRRITNLLRITKQHHWNNSNNEEEPKKTF